MLLAGMPTVLHAQSSPSISIELSPGHHVPPFTAVTATITLSNLDVGSYSSVIFRADLTVYGRGERGCDGDDTGRDLEIAVDESQEIFTARVYDACAEHHYGNYTLDAKVFKADTSAPGGKVELASATTAFLMSRFLELGDVIGPPPAPGVKAWLDPHPTALDMYVGEWHRFTVRSDVRLYINDHVGLYAYSAERGRIHFTSESSSVSPPSFSVEEACRSTTDIVSWRRAIHQSVWIGACEAGDAFMDVRHDTGAVEPLHRYEFRTLARRESEPAVTVSPTSLTVTEGDTGGGSYTVALTTRPPGDVTVTPIVPSGEDVTVSPANLTFAASNWSVAQMVRVTAPDDATAAADRAVTVTHVVSGYGSVTSAASVTVTIKDDDGSPPPPPSGGGGGGGSANRPPVVEKAIPAQMLEAGEVLELNVSRNFYDRNQRALDYFVESGDPGIAAVAVDRNGVLTIRGLSRGVSEVTVTAANRRDERVSQTFVVTVRGPYLVPLFPSAADPLGREGVVRVINRSGEGGAVSIEAIDDTGTRLGPALLTVGGNETVHFNSNDLEQGNAAKGLSGGLGSGAGDWRLAVDSELDFEVLAYIRTQDGFLTAMHDVVPLSNGVYRVAIFNPGSNPNQVSRLRLVNPGQADAEITIAGIDDAGASPHTMVRIRVPAGASETITAAALETGDDGIEGALGDGAGKWQLRIESDQPIRVMSLLRSPTGHLTNLSTAPYNEDAYWPNLKMSPKTDVSQDAQSL